MLFGQGLGLLLGEAALGQALHKAVGVERDGLGHASIIHSRRHGARIPRGGIGRTWGCKPQRAQR